jgi:hypothetical protein
MLIRAVALSLALLLGVGTISPFMTDTIEAGPKHKKKKKREWKGVKKYSKRWWQLYRAQEKRKKALAARKRALRAKQILNARKRAERENNPAETATVVTTTNSETRERTVAKTQTKETVLPSGKKAPKSFQQNEVTSSEQQFSVNDDNGSQLGTASLSVVGPAMGEDADNGRNKMVGGIPTGSLRRNVIDKMMREDGWVVNDYSKDINGKKVYVVVAQSSVRGVIKSRLFYFTEVDGKIYSLQTNSPSESQERIAAESEKVIQSLQRGNRPTQAGLK